MNENRDVVGFEGLYYVNNLGEIHSYDNKCISCLINQKTIVKKSKILKQAISKGYYSVILYKNRKRYNKLSHRLIAEAFIPNPENKRTVNHKNGIKTDNRVENLEWMTDSENCKHSFIELGRIQIGRKGKDNLRSKKIGQYMLDGKFIKEWHGRGDIERELGFNKGNITSCCNGYPQHKTAHGFIRKYI